METTFAAQPTTLEGVWQWWRWMREHDPVSWDEKYGAWHVFRYADIVRVLADPLTFSSDLVGLLPPQPEIELFSKGNFVRMDPPRHDKLRKLVSKAFTPRVVADLEPRITEVTDELLDAVTGEPGFDLVAALAYPLPVTVIAELLGVPASDRGLFRTWADALLNQPLPDRMLPDEETLRLRAAPLHDMIGYLLTHIRDRRAAPRDDLTSQLIDAEVDGERLVDDEIVGFVGLLLIAGHITTTTLLTNTVLCLDTHPDAARDLRADLSLVPTALEEVLRDRAPFPRLARVATAASAVGERTVPAGQVINLWIGSANHDEREFLDPDDFDIRRSPNPHLSFGHGIHFCLGAPLARLEAAIAVPMLLRRCPDLAVADGVELFDARVMAGARRLPVAALWA
ncbi:cytochrome P450 [Luedemannella helvata]|uniref:Cytochrome P450 n=1 Tax=Luedemannella helvata TaxID=349315 RepID=A0ABN2K489_9ACTN